MSTKISVPDIGDFESVEIIEILVKSGDVIKKNDPIVTLESDKSSVEVPSPFEGKISELKVKIGDKVSEGSILATIENGQAISAPKVDKIKKETVEKKIKPQEIKKEERSNGQIVKREKIYAQAISKDDIDPVETDEWIESLNSVIENDGAPRASYLLNQVIDQAYKSGLVLPDTRTTPYILSLIHI